MLATMEHMVVTAMEIGMQMAPGFLKFADGLNLVICNTLFMKQESKLVTYVAGCAKSTVDYIMVRQKDKVKVRYVKVIPNEECIPKHKLLVMDMRFNATKMATQEVRAKSTCMETQGGTHL